MPDACSGTVGYMSPEQVRGQPADARSDIFALGCVLYEMLTGKRAFRKPTSAETMNAILNEDPPAASEITRTIPPALQRVVHRCLEKAPERRFQSASDLAFALDTLNSSGRFEALLGRIRNPTTRSRLRITIHLFAAILALFIAVVTLLWTQAKPVPRVSNYVQLTHDGQQKSVIGTESSRLHFYVLSPTYRGVAAISTSGGEPSQLHILPSANFLPINLSSDGSELLALEAPDAHREGELWSVPLIGGSPRPMGGITGDASWSRDGKSLAYAKGSDIFAVNGDGSQLRKVATIANSAFINNLAWSPDGSHIRFDVYSSSSALVSIWETALDGSAAHRLLSDWLDPLDSACCGRWTADGRYFVFQSQGRIWVVPRNRSLLQRQQKPIRLTSSPMLLGSPTPSADGKRLFVVGTTLRGELMRFDSKSRQYAPFLDGISADYPTFSKDGQWIAYVSYPDGVLWRSRVDGSDRLRLAMVPRSYPVTPRWSPDGRKLVFFAFPSGEQSKVYEISRDGGTPRLVMPDYAEPQRDPNWSPAGDKILFAGNPESKSEIRILDLKTGQLSTLPGSQGLWSPRWSPDGRYVPALSADSGKLLVFDFKTQKWTELAQGRPGWMNWSKDGRYLVFMDQSETGSVLRVRMSDGEIERVLDLKDFIGTGFLGISLALAPDDSPLLLKNNGTQDIYSLDWEAP